MPRCAALLGRDAVTIGLSLAAAASLAARYDLPAALLFPAIVVGFAANTGIAARIAQWKVLYFLGVISYSLYLIHNPFRPIELDLLRWIFPNPLGAKAALLFALLGSLSVIPFAWLTYTRIERPGRTLLRKKSPIILKV
jgi:peptidoglycan/LPS O-acetylase OafA/YrhL